MIKDRFDERILSLLFRWVELKEELNRLFEIRDRKNILQPMQVSINIFQEFLFLSNESELSVEETSILNLKWKPINVVERLNFIKKRPDLYHSFIQLTELMNEQEKQYHKKITLKK